MHYDLATWSVKILLLIPHFAFPKSAIIKRNPLSPTARRAGWVGCVILLVDIPADARIRVVKDGTPESPDRVREQFRRVKPLAHLDVKARGWTLDVLNGIRTLGKTEFTNDDAYMLERHLSTLHPGEQKYSTQDSAAVTGVAGFGVVDPRTSRPLAISLNFVCFEYFVVTPLVFFKPRNTLNTRKEENEFRIRS